MSAAPRIFFFQRSIPPDHSAAGAILFDLAQYLAKRGFSPWIMATREPAKAARRECRDGVEIVRVAALPFSKKILPLRALSLVTSVVSLGITALRLPRPDVIVTLTDPPLVICLADLLARVWRCPHLHWCQDVYPEIAQAAGLLQSPGLVFRFLQRMTWGARRRANRVVAIGRCMQEKLSAGGVKSLAVIPNWPRAERAPDSSAAARDLLDADGKFVVLYSGNLGRTHDFDGLLAAAKELQQRGESVVFAIVGDGPQRASLQLRATAAQLTNLRFLTPRPWSEVPAMLAAADAHLVTLRSEFCGLVVPSKIYDAAACGRPVIFAGPADSECARVIADHHCGTVVPDRNGPALAEAILSLRGSASFHPTFPFGAAAKMSSFELFEQELRALLRQPRRP